MRTIPLRGEKAAGRVALVDDRDYDLVAQYKWHLAEPGHHRGLSNTYADTCIREPGVAPTTKMMHRMILPDAAMVDHINGYGLDNRRSNLRAATATQNHWNRRKSPRSKSPYKGLAWHEDHRKWLVRIYVHKRSIFLGYFADPIDGARAYDAAARHYFGDFARPNFPDAA